MPVLSPMPRTTPYPRTPDGYHFFPNEYPLKHFPLPILNLAGRRTRCQRSESKGVRDVLDVPDTQTPLTPHWVKTLWATCGKQARLFVQQSNGQTSDPVASPCWRSPFLARLGCTGLAEDSTIIT